MQQMRSFSSSHLTGTIGHLQTFRSGHLYVWKRDVDGTLRSDSRESFFERR
jgi:hypothetical protein